MWTLWRDSWRRSLRIWKMKKWRLGRCFRNRSWSWRKLKKNWRLKRKMSLSWELGLKSCRTNLTILWRGLISCRGEFLHLWEESNLRVLERAQEMPVHTKETPPVPKKALPPPPPTKEFPTTPNPPGTSPTPKTLTPDNRPPLPNKTPTNPPTSSNSTNSPQAQSKNQPQCLTTITDKTLITGVAVTTIEIKLKLIKRLLLIDSRCSKKEHLRLFMIGCMGIIIRIAIVELLFRGERIARFRCWMSRRMSISWLILWRRIIIRRIIKLNKMSRFSRTRKWAVATKIPITTMITSMLKI